MTLGLTSLRNWLVSHVTEAALPLLNILVTVFLSAPYYDYRPPGHLHAQYDFIVGEYSRVLVLWTHLWLCAVTH